MQAKGLGKRICDDPPTIQLTFEHKIGDQDLGQDAFYTASRDNRCVVCAGKVHLLRYRVRHVLGMCMVRGLHSMIVAKASIPAVSRI